MKRYDTMGFESEHGVWVRAVDSEERIRELEAALRDLHDFHASNDTQEGHTKRCNRWKGYGCTCGGNRVMDGAKLALIGLHSSDAAESDAEVRK